MKIEMRETNNLWVTFDPANNDYREVIIDNEHKDIRICDGQHVVKLMFERGPKTTTMLLKAVLVDDIYVYPRELTPVKKWKAGETE